MYRDFTYVDDLVNKIKLLIDKMTSKEKYISNLDSLSSVTLYRIFNIGNSNKVKLLDRIEAIEKNLGNKAIGNFMPM